MANLAVTQRQIARERRSETNKAVFALNRFAPHMVKQAIVERNYDAAMNALEAAIRGDGGETCPRCHRDGGPQPWAVTAWMQAAGAIGAAQQVIVNLIARLQVRDEDEALQLVERGRQYDKLVDNASNVGLEEYRDSGLRLLKEVLQVRPEWRLEVLKELGGDP